MMPTEALRSFRISGATLERLAQSEAGMDYLRMMDADWSYLREHGVEEMHIIRPIGDMIVTHHRDKVPWIFRSISVPPPAPEVHPAVYDYVNGIVSPEPPSQSHDHIVSATDDDPTHEELP